MKKNLLTVGMLTLAISANAQSVLTHVDNSAVFYVGEGALVYNGGGMQTKGSGLVDVHGNVMIEGASGDVFRTLDAAGTPLSAAADNFVLRLNDPVAYETSTYGQLYINGIAQGDLSGFVKKEFRAAKHGSGNFYQQIALPFSSKVLSSLSGELAKTFTTQRWTQNEILTYNNITAVSNHFTNLGVSTTNPTAYYMLGSRYNNLDVSTPPATMPRPASTEVGVVYTLSGKPVANGITGSLTGAAANVNFGTGGNAINQYNEKYNTYIADPFETTITAWTGTYAKNVYQFGNPYFTNLDLSHIGINETNGDGNAIANIWGVRYDPGTVTYVPNVGTKLTNPKVVTFTEGSNTPVGDIGLLIKPMQTFVIKLRDNSGATLNFDGLRRFKNTVRASGTDYSVTAARIANNTVSEKGPKDSKAPKSNNGNGGPKGTTVISSVKQLGVIALDASGNEIGRTYYAVSPNSVTGHQTSIATTVQVSNSSSNVIGMYEEEPVMGGYDDLYKSKYWLYINEANEVDFKGKPAPMALFNDGIASLKYEIRENAELINTGVHNLSSGIGFFFKPKNGNLTEIKQGDVVPVTATEYGLYYGAPPKGNPKNQNQYYREGIAESIKPSRTMVAYNPTIDNYVVRFDPSWKKAEVNVFDMSGKLIISAKQLDAAVDFIIELDKIVKSTYIVNIVGDNGEKVNLKINR